MRTGATRVLTDHRSLAATLVPVIHEACGDRLGEITWFKADWQRGGAATGTSTYTIEDGREMPVVLKLPVVRRELLWLGRLQEEGEEDPVVPRLLACGEALGGYDLTWIVMERFPYGPLGQKWRDGHLPRIADAAARFHARAAAYVVDQPPREEPWEESIARAIESVRINPLPDAKRWQQALKTVKSRLDGLVAEWRARDVRQWLHGDLHLANAMSREGLDEGPVSLIDLAEVHAGHWVEDAVYLERQFWARPDRIREHKPVRLIAEARRRLGLPVESDPSRLVAIRRLLLAATAPCYLKSEGHPRHLEACLEWIERGMGELK